MGRTARGERVLNPSSMKRTGTFGRMDETGHGRTSPEFGGHEFPHGTSVIRGDVKPDSTKKKIKMRPKK